MIIITNENIKKENLDENAINFTSPIKSTSQIKSACRHIRKLLDKQIIHHNRFERKK